LILECASCRDCTLEAMRTQVCANQCIDCTVVLFAHTSIKSSLTNPASPFHISFRVMVGAEN
jgi:hypothetical protein